MSPSMGNTGSTRMEGQAPHPAALRRTLEAGGQQAAAAAEGQAPHPAALRRTLEAAAGPQPNAKEQKGSAREKGSSKGT
jgi:hypothetical protein